MSVNKINSVIKQNIREDSKFIETKYLDILVINSNQNNEEKELIFNDNRNSSIVEHSDDYKLYIARMNIITAGSLPIFIPIIQQGSNTNPNLTIYSFTLQYKTFEYQQFIQFQSQFPNETMTIAQAQEGQNLIYSKYYYVNSYEYWVNLVNESLQQALIGLNTLVIAGGDTLPSENAPWILFDPTSYEMVFNADIAGFDSKLTDPINIYLNNPCYNLFSSFQYLNYGNNNITNGKNYKLVIKSNLLNVAEFANYNCIQSYESYNCIYTWSPINSICLISSMLGISKTICPDPLTFGSDINMVSSNTTNNTGQRMITDFQVENGEYLPSINMVPYFPRYLDMNSHDSVNNISISAYWRDHYGNLYPIMLQSGASASLKIAFVRK